LLDIGLLHDVSKQRNAASMNEEHGIVNPKAFEGIADFHRSVGVNEKR
jgi:hypothetical protein